MFHELWENRQFETTPLFGAPVEATPMEFPRDIWHLQIVSVRCLSDPVILSLAVLVQCRLVTDRRADGQMDYQYW